MTIAIVATIAFSLLQGGVSPVNAGRIPLPPPVFSPAPTQAPVCPLNFCDDFLEVCESSGTPEDSCGQSLKTCEPSPCEACDAAVAACNEADGKHCNEVADKCRSELVGCCLPTVGAACPSTETLLGFTPQFCIDNPFGRPFECSTAPPSAKLCEVTIAKVDGCNITLCDYKACAAALLKADCDETPAECEEIAACS